MQEQTTITTSANDLENALRREVRYAIEKTRDEGKPHDFLDILFTTFTPDDTVEGDWVSIYRQDEPHDSAWASRTHPGDRLNCRLIAKFRIDGTSTSLQVATGDTVASIREFFAADGDGNPTPFIECVPGPGGVEILGAIVADHTINNSRHLFNGATYSDADEVRDSSYDDVWTSDRFDVESHTRQVFLGVDGHCYQWDVATKAWVKTNGDFRQGVYASSAKAARSPDDEVHLVNTRQVAILCEELTGHKLSDEQNSWIVEVLFPVGYDPKYSLDKQLAERAH